MLPLLRHTSTQSTMETLIFFVTAVLTIHPVLLQTTELLGNSGFIPQQQTVAKVPAILRLQSNVNPDGSFTYTFDTENGISAHAESTLTKTADPEQSIQTIRGQYSYTGPDGVQYTVQYIADHNGYQAFGEHLPTPPPTPDAILRSLDHNEAHPEEDNGIVAATPALAPASNSILANTNPRSTTPLQPIVAAPLTRFEPLSNPTSAPPTRSPALPTLSKQQQQLAQAQLLAQTQVLQQQRLQPQALQLAQLHPQQFQPQQYQLTPLQLQQLQFAQVQPQQLQHAQLQPRSLQPQSLQSQRLQPQQIQPQQLQPQQIQLQQIQPQQLQLQQIQPQQLQPQQIQLQQIQPQQLQLQPQQIQPQQVQPNQLQDQQLQPQQFPGRQLQSQDLFTQFAPSFQNLESQRRMTTNA